MINDLLRRFTEDPKKKSPVIIPINSYDLNQAPKNGDFLLPDINRPFYFDDNGKKKSEYKMSVNIDGKEVLIPTVVGGRQLSNQEAIDNYLQTGLNMGKFNTVEEANKASELRTAKYNMLQDPVRFEQPKMQSDRVVGNSELDLNASFLIPDSLEFQIKNSKKLRNPLTDDALIKPNEYGSIPDWRIIANRQRNSYGPGPQNVENRYLKGPLTYATANQVSLLEFKDIFETLPGYNTGYESIRDADPKKLGIQEGPLTESRAKDVVKVLPEDIQTLIYKNKTFGTLPLFEAAGIYEGYSPNRVWTGGPYLGMSDTEKDVEGFLQDNGRYLYFISAKKPIEEKFKEQLRDYNNKMPISDLLFGQSKAMVKQLQTNPDITDYLKSKGVDPSELSTTVPGSTRKELYANQLAESIVASRDAKKFNRPYGISASDRESLVIQDPEQFNLSGYLPASSEMFDKEKWKTDKGYKNNILKKAGVPESDWDSTVVHTSPFPIDQYRPKMKNGGVVGWLEKYQDGGTINWLDKYN